MFLTPEEESKVKKELIEKVTELYRFDGKFVNFESVVIDAVPLMLESLLFGDGKITLDLTKLNMADVAKAELIRFIDSFESMNACEFANEHLKALAYEKNPVHPSVFKCI